MCSLSEPSFAVGLDQKVPPAVRAKLDMIRCYLAYLGARTCLIEPRSTIETQDDARDLPRCAAGIEGRHLDLNLERRSSDYSRSFRHTRGNWLFPSQSQRDDTGKQQRQRDDDYQYFLATHYYRSPSPVVKMMGELDSIAMFSSKE
jgi:hypothetical protein